MHSNKKAMERIFAEKAKVLLNADWVLVDIPEPVDFEVHSAKGKFGLEVREIFKDGEQKSGSPLKKLQSNNNQAILKFAEHYYASGGSPINAKFIGDICNVGDVQAFVDTLVRTAPRYPEPNKQIIAQKVKVFMTPLPNNPTFTNYSRWTCVNDSAGWSRKVTANDIQTAVNRKKSKLSLYKQKYENIDLLLVANMLYNYGRLTNTNNLAIINPGFRTIYFMSYPDTIQCLN